MMNRTIIFLILLAMFSGGCVAFKQQAMFDEPSGSVEPEGIDGFYGLRIYDDNLNSEIWFTQSPSCLSVKRIDSLAFTGKSSMLWTWDKNAGGCPWLGIGFGWDAWAPKDVSRILDKAAIRLMVRSPQGRIKGLPLAAALEDYSGGQAWLGFSGNTIQGDYIDDQGWTAVILPLAEFNWEQDDASMTNIKQLIVQFEATGSLLVDDICIVPYDGGFRKRMNAKLAPAEFLRPDNFKESSIWNRITPLRFEGQDVRILATEDHFFIRAEVKDDDPLLNVHDGDDIWNGDAFEMAFSSLPDKPSKRIRYKSTDQHFAIRVSEKPTVWDWRKHRTIDDAVVDIQRTTEGYVLFAALPYSAFDMEPIVPGAIYGLEVAIDDGNEEGYRVEQFRWNNPANDSFHNSPSVWGEMTFERYEIQH